MYKYLFLLGVNLKNRAYPTKSYQKVVRTEETAIKLRDGLVAYYKELQAKYE